MRLFRTTILVLILSFGFSCSRYTGETETKSQVTDNSKLVRDLPADLQNVDPSENGPPQESVQLEPRVEKSDFKVVTTDQNTGWSLWMFAAIFSVLLNVILFLLLLKTIKAKDKWKRQRDDIEIGKNKYKNEALRLSSKLNDLEKKKASVIRKSSNNSQLPNPHKPPKKKETFEDEKSHEVVWPVNDIAAKNISQEVKQPVSLFAEKANEDSTFANVSDQKNEHRSVFKLLLENEQAETAQFEVIDSDFIFKMAANSPDTYLYTVCKPENSNQNFAGEIITVQKGVAHKIDGKWQVKDENKAKIKFQ